jgi:hypothetical protein
MLEALTSCIFADIGHAREVILVVAYIEQILGRFTPPEPFNPHLVTCNRTSAHLAYCASQVAASDHWVGTYVNILSSHHVSNMAVAELPPVDTMVASRLKLILAHLAVTAVFDRYGDELIKRSVSNYITSDRRATIAHREGPYTAIGDEHGMDCNRLVLPWVHGLPHDLMAQANWTDPNPFTVELFYGVIKETLDDITHSPFCNHEIPRCSESVSVFTLVHNASAHPDGVGVQMNNTLYYATGDNPAAQVFAYWASHESKLADLNLALHNPRKLDVRSPFYVEDLLETL